MPTHYKVMYFDEAKINARTARIWYKRQQSGLDKKFAFSIKEAIFRMKQNPLAFDPI